MKAATIRENFINYFISNRHKKIPSSSIIPHNDPSLLFTNAGMNQFKDYFLGNAKPNFNKAVTAQKIIRAGGKHNDLENVGKTEKHHTFFEMLGNFSFGDYFKEQAIVYAWEFLTKKLKLSEAKLAITVYEKDDESFDIWNKKIGLPKDRIAKLGEKDNFWSMGDEGPCGPCSEIHFDLKGQQEKKTIIESLQKDDGRFVEIWNLVFMQYNREKGQLSPLPAPSVDTGMGLERITAVLQNVDSNYKTDLFLPIIKNIEKLANYKLGSSQQLDISVQVIADHIRSTSIMIADGVLPANEGRGYVLRRIIRRALRHANYLNLAANSFGELSSVFVSEFKVAYPELEEQKNWIKQILNQEEKKFSTTLNSGIKILKDLIQDAKKQQLSIIDGKAIFKLYDTYGFPLDLATEILEDDDLDYSKEDFKEAMQNQQQTSRVDKSKTSIKSIMPPLLRIQDYWHKQNKQNEFVGYRELKNHCHICSLWSETQELEKVKENDTFYLLLDSTPFYAESGGQVGDQGKITSSNFIIDVLDTHKSPSGLNYSKAKLVKAEQDLELASNLMFSAEVDSHRRKQAAIHHTAIHLLHSALREVLGTHIRPAGNLVSPTRFRFDFQHFAALDSETLEQIENLANSYIRKNESVTTKIMELDIALKEGALAFFGDKYQNTVRVVQAGSHSKELCGGCHATRTGDLGFLKIISESSIAAGTRRIEAVAGESAYNWLQEQENQLNKLEQKLQNKPTQITSVTNLLKITEQKINQFKKLEQENIELKQQILQNFVTEAKSQIVEKNNIRLLFIENTLALENKQVINFLSQKLGEIVIFLYKKTKKNIEVVLNNSLKNNKFHAGAFIKENCNLIQGRGGGNQILAQAGGNKIDGVKELYLKLKKDLSL